MSNKTKCLASKVNSISHIQKQMLTQYLITG
jgi:hypothetical protein